MHHRRIPVALLLAAAVSAAALAQPIGTPPDFVAPLSGDQEVPAVLTDASGQAQFRLINRGDTLAYRLIVTDIQNVVAAHIHLAPAGVNGPVVAFLFGPAAPGGGFSDGTIAEGQIEAPALRGPLMGQDLSVLIAAMASGGAYVNVHTDDGVAPAGTGPGDIPSGEIRGQILRARIRSPQQTIVGD